MGGKGSGHKRGVPCPWVGPLKKKRPYESCYNHFCRLINAAGYVTDLSYEDFLGIVHEGHCRYCGVPLEWAKYNYSISGTSYQIDRIDNSKDYLKGNCAPCCKICNGAKSKLTVAEFISWASLLYMNLKRNNFVT